MGVSAWARSADMTDGQPVTGGAQGNARAAARRAPQGAKAELPARSRRMSRGRFRPPPPSAPSVTSPVWVRCLAQSDAPDGARRAERAFKAVWKVLTGQACCLLSVVCVLYAPLVAGLQRGGGRGVTGMVTSICHDAVRS
jgi:hypothetical protein